MAFLTAQVPLDAAPLSPWAQKRLDALESVALLVDSGCAKDAAIRSRRVRRRTHCRWQAAWRRHGPAGLEPRSTRPHRRRKRDWTLADVQAVMAVRRQHPFMGLRSIHAVLRKAGSHLSRAAVGRIVRLCLKRKWIKPVVWLRGRGKAKRRRDFGDAHAKRCRYGMKA